MSVYPGLYTATYGLGLFPLVPLDIRYELLLNGTWTDISAYVYQRNDQAAGRGHQDESSTTNPSTLGLTLNNRDGRFTSTGPTGAYYPYIGRNTQLRASVPEGANYLRLENGDVSYAQAPDSAGLSITGDTDIQLDVTLDNWQAGQILAAKWAETGNERSWVFYLQDGLLHFSFSSDGTAVDGTNSAIFGGAGLVPVPGLRRQCLRVTFAASTGTVKFYTSPPPLNGTPSWTQLGDTSAFGSTSIYDSTAPVQVGYCSDASSVGVYGVFGKVHTFYLLSGIGGTAEGSPDFTAQTAGATSFTDAQSNTWTLEGTSEISDRRYRFHGEVAGWPQQQDSTGSDVWVDVAVAGILRRLTQGANARPLQSAFRHALPSATGLVAYWPCEDGNDQTGAGATPAAPTGFASAIQGVRPGTFTGGPPQFASDSTFLCSYPIPTLNKSRWHFQLPSRAADTANVFRFLMHMPSTSDTNNAVIASMYTAGTIGTVDLVYGTGGGLTLNGYNQSGGSLFSSGPWSFGTDGQPYWMSIELKPSSGGHVEYSITSLAPGADSGDDPNGTVSGSVGNATLLVVNSGTAVLSGTAIGQITYQSQWESLFDFSAQLDAYIGETAGRRLQRLADEESLTFRYRGDLDGTVAMGAQTPLSLPDLLQECADADRGQFWEPRQQFALGYRTRRSMENQAAAVTLDYSLKELAADPAPATTEDDQFTINDAVVVNSYTGGSGEVAVTSGPLSVQDPPDGVGYYQQAPQINLAADSQCQDLAGWITWLGTVNEPRFPALTVNLARQANSGLFDDLQELDLGDRLDIINTPAWWPPDGVSQLVQAVAESLNAFVFVMTWTGIPASPYQLAVADDADYGRADSPDSTLHANITSSATSMGITAGTSGELWSTSGGDAPFDVVVAGERITVTAVSGSSSPQTATITRSVNGVVKAQTAGAAITLFYPTIAAL